jgi:hypothetical protein
VSVACFGGAAKADDAVDAVVRMGCGPVHLLPASFD